MVIGSAAATSTAGVDVYINLSPLEVQDADPAKVRSRSIDVPGHFQRTDAGENAWQLSAVWRFRGAVKNDVQHHQGKKIQLADAATEQRKHNLIAT